MDDLFWPGDERAGELMSEPALLHAMVRVESAWLRALLSSGIAPHNAADDLSGLVTDEDVHDVAVGAEAGGNPVIPLLSLLRERIEKRSPEAAAWIHRGLTSQDVLDTALALCLRDTADRIREELHAQIIALAGLSDQHRQTLMAGRTLTQHAVPITFGLKAAVWLGGVLDAADDLIGSVELPVQIGGAAGTLASPTELIALSGSASSVRDLTSIVSEVLGLKPRWPWHTSRAPFTRFGDALVRCTDAWGHIATDILTLSRPEIAEVAEPTAEGRGSSSAMPQKTNPVLSTLIKRAALAVPMAGAQLHLAAAESVDERPDGAWHTEWSTLHTLSRRTVVAASQTTELLSGLGVNADRMRATAMEASAGLLAERRSLSTLFGVAAADGDPSTYLGATGQIIDAALERAATFLKEPR